MKLRENAVIFLATGFYVGNLPFAPGTFGSLIGIPLSFAIAGMSLAPAMLCILIFSLFAIYIADTAEKLLKQKDPGCIVIDEIAGMTATLIGLPFNLITVVIGFIVFRILDILKPFPIRNLDNRISGGLGVVADDLAAGIFANLLLRIFF
jgi:phosphatidylglycerophosphatase A